MIPTVEAEYSQLTRELDVRYGPRRDGDVRVTAGVIDRARALLGYDPRVDLEEGIARQWELVRST